MHDTSGGWRSGAHLGNSGELSRTAFTSPSSEGTPSSAQRSEHITASLLDFLDAERSYRATQLAWRQTIAAYLTALEQLREAVGTRSLP